MLAITGASAALALSAIPFEKTIAGVRVGLVDGSYVINPTYDERKQSTLDLIVAGSADGILMVEAGAKEVTEPQVVGALEAAHAAIKQLVAAIDELKAAAGKKKLTIDGKDDRRTRSTREAEAKMLRAARRGDADQGQARELRHRRQRARATSSRRCRPTRRRAQRKAEAKHIFNDLKEKVLRDEVLERGMRLDGRKFDEIRPIWTEAGVLPRVHGSAVFTRGETQALVTCTLGTADDEQKVEHVSGEYYKRFMLHYNFPPFSVGEVGRFTGPGRREVGHGALAERALTPVLPDDGQVPLHRPHRLRHPRVERLVVDGVGLRRLAGDDGRRRADQGAGGRHRDGPDHGREDRQVRRPLRHRRRRGPLRRHGLQGRRHRAGHHRAADGHQGRRHHLRGDGQGARPGARRPAAHPRRDGQDAVGEPRKAMSTFAPRIVTIKIPVDKIRDVIGPGGKMIRSIIERTGVKIDVEDDGTVNVASADGESAAEGDRHHPGADRDAGAEQDLHGQGAAHHRFRRVRRDHAGHRRPAARLRDRQPPRQGRARRAEGRPADPGEGHQHRPHRQDPPEPEGAAPGRSGEAGRGWRPAAKE